MAKYLAIDPMCRRSGLCSKVEKGGGLLCPSKLPLKFEVSKESRICQTRTNILTLTGMSRAVEFAKEYSSMTVIDKTF